MKIIGSIQARMSSTRLPGKVLKPILGKPMLLWHIERLRRSRLLDDIIVATTEDSRDEPIVRFCETHDIKYFRGSEEDVLDRIASMIDTYRIDVHAEFFGDSPLTDPHIVDETIGYFLKHRDQFDFVSNHQQTTYPPGQEVLVYWGRCLIEANRSVAKADPLREHVSIHITQHPDLYRLKNLPAPERYHYPDIYLEVDTEKDFDLMTRIITHFDSQGQPHFSLAQILDHLHRHPELVSINNTENRRWKAFREDDV